jgi:hypothetical protein
VSRARGAAVALAAAVAACTPSQPMLANPVRVDSTCGQRVAQASAIESILTSTDDRLLPQHPTGEGVRREVLAAGGAVAYWHDQLLHLPRTAEALGETDGYARVRAIGITEVPDGTPTRTIDLDVRDHGAYRWFAMTAYDTQSVCIVGRPQA